MRARCRIPSSRRSAIRMSGIALLFLALPIASCAPYLPADCATNEWAGPDVAGMRGDRVANLDWSKLPGVIALLDGQSAGACYERAKLKPGPHVIEYAYYPAEFGAHPRGTVEIDLKQGHVYDFRIKLCFWCTPRRFAVWIEDRTTGEPVWGKRPDWPSWYL